MNAGLKFWIKRVAYQLYQPHLPDHLILEIGFIFHVEKIQSAEVFEQLVDFCERYQRITGKKAITALMAGSNPLIIRDLEKQGVSQETYLKRAQELARVSTLGYHGHFWRDEQDLDSPSSKIKGGTSDEPSLESQFLRDLDWFRTSGLDHHGIYSGGWWYMSEALQNILIKNGFRLDFTMSQNPPFQNPFSMKLLNEVLAHPGNSILIQSKLLCIQNWIGCQPSPFLEDFYRNLKRLFTNIHGRAVGVVHSHDYDLKVEKTLECIQALHSRKKTKWMDANDFFSLKADLKK